MLAMTTGLMFARFSRPTAWVLFSRNAVIGAYDGGSTLFVGVANERGNQVVEASATMTLVRDETVAQTIHARASYTADELLWGHRFLDIFGYTDDGCRAIDFSRFHHREPL